MRSHFSNRMNVYIIHNGEFYEGKLAATNRHDDFISLTERYGWNIVASNCDLLPFEINMITGCSIKSAARKRGYVLSEDIIEVGPDHLENLTDRLNSSDGLDMQHELDLLVERFRKKT